MASQTGQEGGDFETGGKRQKEEYEIRRQKAFNFGKGPIWYRACPLCGFQRPLTNKWGTSPKFKVRPDYAIVHARFGGGRKIGFFRDDRYDMSIETLSSSKDPLLSELWNNLRTEVHILNDIIISLESGQEE